VGPVEEALHTGACLGCGRPLESNRKRYCSPQCARHSAYVRNREAILLRRRERYWRRKREKGSQ
jgi:Zn finger protein HypA/HybF involved in hydrogenase expression